MTEKRNALQDVPPNDSSTGLNREGLGNWLAVGCVGKPHGLQGAFFVSGRAIVGLLAEGVKSVLLLPPNRSCEVLTPSCDRLKLESFMYPISFQRLVNQRLILKLSGLETRTQIEAMHGQEIFIARVQVKLGEGEYLWSDLIGREVLDSQMRNVGVIVAVENFGASDFMTVRKDGQAFNIPIIATYVDIMTLSLQSLDPSDKATFKQPVQLRIDYDALKDFAESQSPAPK